MNEEEANELLHSILPDRLVTNYVLVCETYDNDGYELHVITSDSTTPWLAMGMVDSAQDIIQMGHARNVGMLGFDGDEDWDE